MRGDQAIEAAGSLTPPVWCGAGRGRKPGRRLWAFWGCAPSDRRRHLEHQFTKGAAWYRFPSGEIHIDHIQPVSSFDLDCEADVLACYFLWGLRPLWASENLAKRAQVEVLI